MGTVAQVAGYEVVVQILLNEEAKAKASGILVVVGVGTYLAYRLCVRYLGPEFLTTLIAQLHPPKLQKPMSSTPYVPPHYDFLADDEWSDSDEEEVCSYATSSTYLSPQMARRSLPAWLRDEDSPSHHRGFRKGSPRHASTPQSQYNRRHQSYSPFRSLQPQVIRASTDPPSATPPGAKQRPDIYDLRRALNDGSIRHRASKDQLLPPELKSRLRGPNGANSMNGRRTQDRSSSVKCSPISRIKLLQRALEGTGLEQLLDEPGSDSENPWIANSPPPLRRKRPKTLLQLDSGAPSAAGSAAASICGATPGPETQFTWDPLCTPDVEEDISRLQAMLDRASPETGRKLLHRLLANASPAPSEFSEISVAANVLLGDETADNLCRLQGDISVIKDEVDDLNMDISDLLQRSQCLANSKDYYRSVMLAPSDLSSEIGSITSMDAVGGPISARSQELEQPTPSRNFPAYMASPNLERPPIDLHSQQHNLSLPVLNEPIQHQKPGMLRSGDSYETQLSMDRSPASSSDDGGHSSRKLQISSGSKNRSPLVDSAIWTDPGSSDGGSELASDSNWLVRSRSFGPSLGVTPEEPSNPEERTNSEARSNSAAENRRWDEDAEIIGENSMINSNELNENPSTRSNCGQQTREGSPSIAFSEFSMEWEEMRGTQFGSYSPLSGEAALDPSSPNKQSCNSLTSGSRRRRSLGSARTAPSLDDDRLRSRLPPETRDLKLLARDLFFTNPMAAPVLQQLHRRCKLSRTLALESHPAAPLFATLHSLIHRAFPIFKCNNFKIVSDAIQLSLKRCNFLHLWPIQWVIASQFHLATAPGKISTKSIEIYLLRCLKSLWNLHEIGQNLTTYDAEDVSRVLRDQAESAIIMEAMKVLMVLKALEAYEETLITRQTSRAFYADVFRFSNPRKLMEQFAELGTTRPFSSTELALLADTLDVRLEVFKIVSDHPQVAAVYPEKSGKKEKIAVSILESAPDKYFPLFYCP